MQSEVRSVFVSSVRPQGLRGLLFVGVASSVLALAGCGNNYRPVVSAINPVGPASQPQKYAVAVSSTGIVTVADFSGDTVLGTVEVTTSPVPSYLTIDPSNNAYILHCDTTHPTDATKCNGVIDAFSVSNQVLTRNVYQTSLVDGATPTSLVATASSLYTAQQGNGTTTAAGVGVLTPGAPPTAVQVLPVAANPTYVVSRSGASRVYALSAASCSYGGKTGAGTATAILTSNNNLSDPVCVGGNPIYGVLNSDFRRAFVMNKASGTVSVINTQTNALDTTSTFSGTITVDANPLWADTADSINELAVVNGGSSTSSPGSLSIIGIPLCSTSAESSNGTCDATNPSDATNFGTVLRTVAVGNDPRMVTILQDQNKAYVANYGSESVSVVDMNTFIKTKDISLGCHPVWIAATGGTPTGKVYAVCDDSTGMSVIYTDTDTLQSQTIPIQGNGVSVRVTAQ